MPSFRFPDKWGEYIHAWQDKDPSDAVLSLCEDTRLKNISACPNGWECRRSGDLYQTAYFQDKKALFMLEYGHPVEKVTVYLNEGFSYAVRPALQFGTLTALYRQCIGLHGVTVRCGDEIVILSAPSGTGKTTLSKLLEEYADATVINGDFALVSLSDEGVWFEPSPFCGSSGICLNHRVQVDRVVFLSQSMENQLSVLSPRQAVLQFMSNCFTPVWDPVLLRTVEDNILRCVSGVKVNAFGFAPDQDAAEIIRSAYQNR